jgi:transglutaminase-like putative cysteine protease
MRLSIASALATLCAAALLYQLFDGAGWLWTSIGAALSVLAASALSGRLSLPAWAAGLVSLAGLGVFLTASFAGEKAWLLVVPTKGSLAELAGLVGTGWEDIQRFAAPVPGDLPGISLLTSGGVGLIAVTVDLLAARMRRAALAGLPILALATVPATILPDPISWPAFVLAALGFTGLLLADGRERVGHWGRAVLVRRTRPAASERGGAVADVRGLRLSGKRIGFAAIVLAVLVPAMVPPLQPVSFFTFGVGGSGSGGRGNSISIPNPVTSLRGQLELPARRTVLTYTSDDDRPRYLRIFALDTFNGEMFGMTDPKGEPENRTSEGPLPPPPGLTGAVPVSSVTTDITVSEEVEKLEFLPLPYAPGTVNAEGDWRADVDTLMVFSTRDDASGLRYQVTTTEPRPSAAQLRALPNTPPTIDERYLRLPADFPDDIRALARRATDGAESAYDSAVALQEWFTKTGNFTYNLRTQGHSTSALRDFLLSSRTGFCEQFAISMALLARSLGIPARVAIGYTGGVKTGTQWTVTTSDSHSWPELYFEGAGWLAFEPTPSGLAGQGSARVPDYSVPQEEPEDDAASVPTPGATGRGEESAPESAGASPRNADDREALLQPTGVPEDEPMPVALRIAIGVAALALVLLVPAAIRAVTRRRRVRALSRPGRTGTAPAGEPGRVGVRTADGADVPVAAAWAELDDVLYDYGMARGASETPRALARRLAGQYGFDTESAAAMAAIADSVERALFARAPGPSAPLGGELKRVRRALAATVSRGRRIRAVLLPPSTLRRFRALGESLLDGFDRLEDIRLRRTTGRRT